MLPPDKIKVAVIMGGYSSEYEISLLSGQRVCEELNRENFDVYPVIIRRDKWVYRDENAEEHPVDRSDFSFPVRGEKIKVDVVFNAIHGHPGEDGLILAYFELLGIPHTSDHSYLMALTFNKKDCISVLSPSGIPHARSLRFRMGENIPLERIGEEVGFPCFVKSNKAGSSFGVSKVKHMEELPAAIDNALAEDDEVIIEEFLEGTEVSVGVITYRGEVRVLPPTEIVSQNEFFDYEAKYKGLSKEITPARIAARTMREVMQMAERVYRTLGMKGLSRAEYIIRDGVPYFLEINTVPGLTGESILPKQLEAAGMQLRELIEDMIDSKIIK